MKELIWTTVIFGLLSPVVTFGQLNVPDAGASVNKPVVGGSWLKFETGGSPTSIVENWGLNLTGSETQQVKIRNTSLLVGYNSENQNYGVGNALVSGRIGAGTLDPKATLDVNGNIHISNAIIPMGIMTELPGTSNPLINLSLNFREANKNIMYVGGAMRIDSRENVALFQWLSRMPGSDQENILMSMNRSGDLGIGTSEYRGYKLAVNGNIRVKEVKVEAGPWPDYVFDGSYKLPSLSMVEKFIGRAKHLPDIPSARTIITEGVNLGEMNRLLLKKVEELTLYLIEKDKQMAAQQKLTSKQGKQMKQLRTRLRALETRLPNPKINM